MAAGIRYARLSPPIRTVLVRAAAFGLAASALPALMPLVARDLIGGGPLTYGVLLGAFGLGAVGGAVLGGKLRGRVSTENLVRYASLGLAIGGAVTALGMFWLALPALAIAGGGWVLALSTFNVSVQMASPRWVVARAIALYQMAAFGGMATGSWLFGSIAIGLVLRLPQISDLNLDPRNSWTEPHTAVPVDARSGPIVITVEHRIAQTDITIFLRVMAERRRIRSRDGAREWTLLRDLADPTLWIERFHFSTWLEYVRHNERRTHADEANSDALHKLWIPGTDAVVHRRIERQTSALPFLRASDAHEFDPVTDPSRSN
jgi:MFS family permease